MVYVWGSNSSHQLAEGTLEKILHPKLAQGFSDAQMVRASAPHTGLLDAVHGLFGGKVFARLTHMTPQ